MSEIPPGHTRRPNGAPQVQEPPAYLPFYAGQVLDARRLTWRALRVLILIMVLIEGALFLAPKVGALIDRDAAWTSFSIAENPLRERVFAEAALKPDIDYGTQRAAREVAYSLRSLVARMSANTGQAELASRQSIFQIVEEGVAQQSDKQVDVFDCWNIYFATNTRRAYTENGCAQIHDWLVANDLLIDISPRKWTILTSTFLHAGLLHITLNMLALVAFAPLAFLRMGVGRFMLFFLLAGVAGFLMHIGIRGYLRGNPQMVVGASGAIMGCLGYHWRTAWERFRRKPAALRPSEKSPARLLLSMALAFLWADMLFLLMGGFISGEAHIGGLLFGFFFGPLFVKSPQSYRRWLKRRAPVPILPVTRQKDAS